MEWAISSTLDSTPSIFGELEINIILMFISTDQSWSMGFHKIRPKRRKVEPKSTQKKECKYIETLLEKVLERNEEIRDSKIQDRTLARYLWGNVGRLISLTFEVGARKKWGDKRFKDTRMNSG